MTILGGSFSLNNANPISKFLSYCELEWVPAWVWFLFWLKRFVWRCQVAVQIEEVFISPLLQLPLCPSLLLPPPFGNVMPRSRGLHSSLRTRLNQLNANVESHLDLDLVWSFVLHLVSCTWRWSMKRLHDDDAVTQVRSATMRPRLSLAGHEETQNTRLVISFLRALLLNRVSCVCSLTHSLSHSLAGDNMPSWQRAAWSNNLAALAEAAASHTARNDCEGRRRISLSCWNVCRARDWMISVVQCQRIFHRWVRVPN